jgi:imidazolonepropionase-like amidohydrolase
VYAAAVKRLAVLLLVVACGKRAEPPKFQTQAGDLVFADVTVAPMDRDTTLAHQTVVVRGDKIVAVAPAVALAQGITKIDGAGKWLMPGLADMHVHTWNPNDLTMFVVAGVTTVRNMFGSEQHLAWRQAIADGKQFGPTLVTASPIIDGDPPVWPGSIVLTKPGDVDGVVAGLKGKGYDFLKPYARLEKPVYEALVAASKKHGLTLQGHVPRAVKLEDAVAAGQKSVEHVDGWFRALSTSEAPSNGSYWKTLAATIAKVDETRIPALAEVMKKAGTYNCPTLIVTARMAALENPASIQPKWLDLIAPEVRATWDPKQDFRLASADADDYKAMRAANVVRDKIVRVLATSGAPLIVGTDTGNPYVIPGEGMHDEIELMIAAGASRPRVLRAATADSAKFLGRPHDGLVAVGANADLLLVDVDPMTKPLPLVPAGVVLRGSWIPKSELDAKLAALKSPAAPKDRFAAMPPLAGDGLHYDYKNGDKVIGEERIVIAAGVFHAQAVFDVPGHVETTYQIAGQTTKLVQKTTFGEITLEAAPAGDTWKATGKDASGRAIDTSVPLPKDAILGSPGIGDGFELAAKLATMKVGDKRKLTSLELTTFPSPGIERAELEVTRTSPTTFSISMRYQNMTLASELVVDDKSLPLSQSFGPPISFTIVRR